MDFLEKFEALPESVQNVFGSNEPRLALERACFLYNIFEDDISKLTQHISDIFLKELPLIQFPLKIAISLNVDDRLASGIAYEITKKIFLPLPQYFSDASMLMEKWQMLKSQPLISEEKAGKRVQELEPWILEEEKEKMAEQAEAQKKVLNLSLNKALDSYPQLGEQVVTNNLLKLKYQPDPVRPSIKNWIADFHDNLGSGKHSPIERGDFLFHSENGKKLTASERQKLSLIFKSLDEDFPLTIDPVAQTVVFVDTNRTNKNTNYTYATQDAGVQTQAPQVIKLQANEFAPAAVQEEELVQDAFERFAARAPMQTLPKKVVVPKPVAPNFAAQNDSRVVDLRAKNDIVPATPIAPRQQVAIAEVEQTYFQRPNIVDNTYAALGSKGPLGSENFFAQEQTTPEPENQRPTSQIVTEKIVPAPAVQETPPTKNLSPNFASGQGIVTFSSPQKLAVEQSEIAAQPSAPAANIQPAAKRPTLSPFRIVHSQRFDDDESVAGLQDSNPSNIVNLKK